MPSRHRKSSLWTWAARIAAYTVAAFIIHLLLQAYATSRMSGHVESCGMAGVETASPLERGRAIAACIDRHSRFPETWYFDPAGRMFDAVPNNPCRYVGAWTSTRPGSVYRVNMYDDGRFDAEFVAGRPADEYISGRWSFWKQQLVWFYDRGHVWPPDANPVEETDADRFSLIEHNGSRTQFTRLENLPSKRCHTGDTSAAPDTAETTRPDIAVPADLPPAPPVAQWAGRYRIPSPEAGDTLALDLQTDGSFSAGFGCRSATGATTAQSRDNGYLQAADEWYQVNATGTRAAEGCRLPSRLWPLQWAGQRYLLSERQLAWLVNQINAGGHIATNRLLQAETGKASTWDPARLPALPSPYRAGLQPTPLQGLLTTFGPVAAASPQDLLSGDNFRSRATLNLGTRNGVFNGMAFYPAGGPANLQVEVIDARLDQATVRLQWQGDWRPEQPLAVSTRPAGKPSAQR